MLTLEHPLTGYLLHTTTEVLYSAYFYFATTIDNIYTDTGFSAT